ncbi:MAG: hypothetical protein EOP38_19315 [Rubrivivax sp.]|nr:MAG: hypothetical protein EOP38_19315 [Rubrivivax sp.]
MALVGAAVLAPALAFAENTYLEITLKVDPKDRPAAAGVYTKYKGPFLATIAGAKNKELLIRDEDVQVLHTFASKPQAEAYLKSDMFNKDVVKALSPLLKAAPEVRIYAAN